MLFAEHAESLFFVSLLDLHEVTLTPGTLNVERNSAARGHALHRGPSFLQTDNALQRKPLLVKLGKSYWGLGRHQGSRYPRATAQVHPLVQSISWLFFTKNLKLLVVSLQKNTIVFGYLRLFLLRLKVKLHILFYVFRCISHIALVLPLSLKNDA
jgi:hypothetical protein